MTRRENPEIIRTPRTARERFELPYGNRTHFTTLSGGPFCPLSNLAAGPFLPAILVPFFAATDTHSSCNTATLAGRRTNPCTLHRKRRCRQRLRFASWGGAESGRFRGHASASVVLVILAAFNEETAALFLFAALRRLTGARWPSAFVAFIFALHRLHMESVAWVAERRDEFCVVFRFLAFFCYSAIWNDKERLGTCSAHCVSASWRSR